MLSSQDAVAVLRRTIVGEPIPDESAMKSALVQRSTQRRLDAETGGEISSGL
jgi:hypothetical protein